MPADGMRAARKNEFLKGDARLAQIGSSTENLRPLRHAINGVTRLLQSISRRSRDAVPPRIAANIAKLPGAAEGAAGLRPVECAVL
jgi:hypothetical protein